MYIMLVVGWLGTVSCYPWYCQSVQRACCIAIDAMKAAIHVVLLQGGRYKAGGLPLKHGIVLRNEMAVAL